MKNFNILLCVRKLIDQYPELDHVLKKYLSGQKFTSEDKSNLLNDLAILLLIDNYTTEIATLFSPILLDLLSRASDLTKDDPIVKHEWLCICLSKLIWNFPEVARFAKLYFEEKYSFFCRFEDDNEPPSKKFKSSMVVAPVYKLLKAANLLLIYDSQSFKDLCDWTVLISFLNDEEPRTRWYAYHCLGHIFNVKNIDVILKTRLTSEEYLCCASEELENQIWTLNQFRPFKVDVTKKTDLPVVRLQNYDFVKDVVNVEGVLLSRNPYSEGSEKLLNAEKYVHVPTIQQSLYRLAVAVSSGEPVLLQGPVGCGKTSIVEHLAAMTGRKPFKELLKVQLGDHMDAKMLLGTHICTEVPGEFIWQSGILIQAMTEGHWLLLEDIDCAPLDVISLLVPVLQSRTVILPGHANPIKAAAGFQLFATQRLIRSLEGSYVEFRSNIHVIGSHLRKIMMQPLSKIELKQIINTKWPRMEKICDKILEIYSVFSLDLNDEKNSKSSSGSEPFNFHCHHGRLVSTRDLFKFCARISSYFESSKKDVSVSVFQNAVECFCDSLPCSLMRSAAGESIGGKINISNSKANSICQKIPTIEKRDNEVIIGRSSFPRAANPLRIQMIKSPVFAYTKHSCALLEKVAVAVAKKEPVLLVGETGTGKTSVVQYLAHVTQNKLTVINMSQQSDSVDLIGGYKPVGLDSLVRPLKDKFLDLFSTQNTVDVDANKTFLGHISNCYYKRNYEFVVDLILHALKKMILKMIKEESNTIDQLEQISEWKILEEQFITAKHQIEKSKNTLIFKFIEGALVKAMKKGDWLLLDEINLAEAETLECLSGVLEKHDNTLFLYEKGCKEPVIRHENFRIFACMNPATDVGKKDLPVGIRNRFTEFFVDEIEERQDLFVLVQEYLRKLNLKDTLVENIVNFYLHMKNISVEKLSDGAGHYPHYSLRTLCRALKYASKNPCHNVSRSLYEAFCLSFLSQLDNESHILVAKIIAQELLGKNESSVLKQSIPEPSGGNHIPISGYWIRSGKLEPHISENYIFTNTVKRNLQDLARIVSASQYPVLLQGETSVGKTSLIQWLAKASGNVCVRVNNHEHTDIQEYVGTYSVDTKGKLAFKEGILAEAMRNGYWIILDELNLAPTEVMEALNRVLDDNRELFIPETQTMIKAHPGFMIFATQNPPGLYGGRKVLSRAFRNRFIELHFNEIPPTELEVILHERCKLPLSYSKTLVAVMHDLQMRRRNSGVFSGKQGFITLRDLFRWGERYEKTKEPAGGLDWLQHLADEGYLLLAGKVRHPEEANVIQETIKKHLKREVNTDLLFNLSEKTPLATKELLTNALHSPLSDYFKNVVWTYNMRRLAVLVGKAIQYEEPVLLIGSTGSGKTTVCQIYSEIYGKTLNSVNCHMHSESADFLGGLRPVRDPELRESKLFEWKDGPLIQAMGEGHFFLADEISLADDSVLERLNSVLEPERKILVPERRFGDPNDNEITAEGGFHFFATMNPGGDYGKKELSPALRNRFTEIWCPNTMCVKSDVIDIVEHNINKKLKFQKYAIENKSGFGHAIADFLEFFSKEDTSRRTLSIRDVLTWVEFINMSQTFISIDELLPYEAYIHGAFLAFLDGIGSGSSGSDEAYLLEIKRSCFEFLIKQVGEDAMNSMNFIELMMPELFKSQFEKVPFNYVAQNTKFGLGPFNVDCGTIDPSFDENWASQYILDALTPKANVTRILRAMQLPKPILLEGSPGVGKTSLVSTLSKVTGHGLVRINLSEQTDITDLFGADLPVDGGEKGEFAWRDGPLIQALKRGDWILLDELNLASQSVLEGLNACLDHRNEIYIPEIGMTFYLDKSISRIFCCQNPQKQGGSRKGLPQSFLNRFTQVYMKPLEAEDLQFIITSVYPTVPPQLVSAMVKFNYELSKKVNSNKWGQQVSWEFNLRDIFRWCDVMVTNQVLRTNKANQRDNDYNIGEYVKLIYMDRLRTEEDKHMAIDVFKEVIEDCGLKSSMLQNRSLKLNVFENCVQLGYAFLPRKGVCRNESKMTCILPYQLKYLESLMKCLEMNWMAILVGPSGCGKSTLVRALAELCGQQLQILSVNSEMDTIELLGGFEQADINRKIEFIAQDLQPVLEQGIAKCLMVEEYHKNKKLQELLFQHHNVRQCIYSASSLKENDCSKKLNCLQELIKVLESMKLDFSKSVLKSCKNALENLRSGSKESFTGGSFEWVDSILINAARKGHWLLIDDANFCSSSVLDRLNALLEPRGVLTINEQGIVNGEMRTIVPHEDFRIILTMNPKYGEISRAMRNRGVEIYVEPATSQNKLRNREIYSVLWFAQCKGLIHNKLLFIFCSLYEKLIMCSEIECPSVSDFINAVTLCVQMIQKHGNARRAFGESCAAVFAESHLNASARDAILKMIKEEGEFIDDIKVDYGLAITDLLPSSFDYRQSSVLSGLKKQACVFILFYKDYVGKILDCPPFPESKDGRPVFVCQPPQVLQSHHLNYRIDIKKFTSVMHIVFESCPINYIEYLIYIINNWMQNVFGSLKESDKDTMRPFLGAVRNYHDMIEKLFSGPLVKKLKDTTAKAVSYIFKESESNTISPTEVPLDLRWNPHIYQKILQKVDDSKDVNENEIVSRANRCSLLLLYRSFTFVNELVSGITNCKNLAVCADEAAKNPNLYKGQHFLPKINILPKFIEAFTESILKFIEDESIPCTDEYYWKLFDTLSAFNVFQQVYLMHCEKGIESQLRNLGFYVSLLLKKIQIVYRGISMPYTLTKYADELEILFSYNLPTLTFRNKFMKEFGMPPAFRNYYASETCRRINELYQSLDTVELIKAPQSTAKKWKVIFTSQKPWLKNFTIKAYEMLYGKEKHMNNQVLNYIQQIKNHMVDTGVIETENVDNDDDIMVMEVFHNNSTEPPKMSNETMIQKIQLLALWDYLFVTYEAESLAHCLSAENINSKEPIPDFALMFENWSTHTLGLNPIHLSHLLSFVQLKKQESTTPSLLYFFRHLRHGFSSDGLSALNVKVEENNIAKNEFSNKHWNNYSWSKQQPVLSCIFSTLIGKSNDSDLMCHFPLGTYPEQLERLKSAQFLVWKNFDRLANTKKTFRYHSAGIIQNWFHRLLHALRILGKSEDTKIYDKPKIQSLLEELKIVSLVRTDDNENILLEAFDCVVELQNMIEATDDRNLQWFIGKTYILVGLLTSMILMPRDSYDPAMKTKTKHFYYQDIRNTLMGENEMRRWMRNITCGESMRESWLPDHPHIQYLSSLCKHYEIKRDSTRKKIPFRNNDEMFENLIADVCHYVGTLLHPKKILDLVVKLGNKNASSNKNEDISDASIIQRTENLCKSLDNFVVKMLTKYPLYPDLLIPFLVGVEQIIFGLSMSCHSVIIKESKMFESDVMAHLNACLEEFSQLSTGKWESSLHMVSSVLNSSTINNFTVILTRCKEHFPNQGRLLYKLIKSAVLELINVIKFQNHYPESKLSEIKELLFLANQWFYKAWHVQDEIIKRKKEEEENLFKTVHHEAELSDEEKMNKELKEMFPLYEEEFSDTANQMDSDDPKSKQNFTTLTESGVSNGDTADFMAFSDADMFEVCQLHATVIALLTDSSTKQNANLFVKCNQELDLITPYLLRHEVVSCFVTALGHRLDSFFEKNLLEEQLLLSQELHKMRNQEMNEYYDIYHDPNSDKVIPLNPILQKLINHVTDLLKEFPENPNLVQILTITQRVWSFSISDPLMKFVVGLELILDATQHWEQNAHSKVSLKVEIDEITRKIIEFRSMELDFWKIGLQNVIKKQYLKCSRWWFFLFSLFYEDNTNVEKDKEEIMKGLQQYFEESSIGEYPARLHMLHAFLQEFNLQSSKKSNRMPYPRLADYVFNIYRFYEQFLPAIEKEISQIRKPIEKEIKDFVKIARWNDLNFYSVKASVVKSHKFILKHVKTFEDGLQKKAKTVLVLPSKNSSEVGEGSWMLEIKEKDFIYDVPKVKTDYFRNRNEAFFQKLPKYQKKVSKLVKQVAETFPVTGYINTLNDFCGNIIEALESVTMDGQKSVCTRSREKKQALIKIQNKKQMLSTLFKNLKAIGLSYKLGIIKYNEDRSSQFLSLPAFDISKMKILKSDRSFKELLSKSSCDTNHYFYKSLAQYTQLHQYMESPSKELTLDIIQRIQGYGSHLLTLVSSQRIAVVKTMKDVDAFGCFLSTLSTMYEKQDYTYEKNLTIVPPQTYFKESDLEINNLIVIITLAASQFGALLECAPGDDSHLKELLKLHPSDLDCGHLSSIFKDDTIYKSIKHALGTFNYEIKNVLFQLSNWKLSETVASWDHLRTFSTICQSVQKSMATLMNEIESHCKDDSPFIQNLAKLKKRMVERCNDSKTEEDIILDRQMHSDPVEESTQSYALAKMCQKLATQLVLAIQEMVVFSASTTTEDISENVVPENIFTAKIAGSLSKAKECLRFEKISKIIRKLRVHFSHFQNSTEELLANDKSFRLLVNLAPLLNQYYQIIKVYLAVSLGMHRTSCKFLTILLEIFTILATKGFCIPPELQEEAAKAGATKFEDIESGGLGEGEGTKDVSGQIESEDQLEDAMKEGEEKKEDESKDKDLKDEEEGIEMSEDFEGKLHSGDDNAENSDEEDQNDEPADLEKQMGEVDDEAEKLDDKVWGSDSENEEEKRDDDDDGGGGVTENMQSELMAKNNRLEDDADEKSNDKGKQPEEVPIDQPNEEYEGEKPDPMINAPPSEEPEIEELPENMEITDEVDKDADGENLEEMNEPEDKLEESQDELDEENKETEDVGENKDGESNVAEEDAEGETKEGGNVADQEETEQEAEGEKNEYILPTQTPTAEVQALPSAETKKSSSDPVQTEEPMDWETGAQSGEQHKEGISDAADTPSADPGHEGRKSSAKSREAPEAKEPQKLKPAGIKRSVDELAEEQNAKKHNIMDQKSCDKPSNAADDCNEAAEMYEHVSKEEESKFQAIDIATQEEAKIRTAQNQRMEEEEEAEIIELSSSDEDEEPSNKVLGETLKSSQGQKPGNKGEEESETVDIPEGEVVETQTVSRSDESTIHTQNELWKSMAGKSPQIGRLRHTRNLHMTLSNSTTAASEEKWRRLERPVTNLSQELCEQLRLVLEPTKTSKFKGDYRTGKRLNMRKIIPYIASQFRKDKIWLRRTKPSKRQYQIMLAMDDSSSMGYNNAKQLAYESLVVLGHSLTLLEAGELSVISFGENVQLLHGFQDQFSSNTGARILEQITFAQKETKIVQLLDFTTDFMVQARNNSQFSAVLKETAQLLIIISDGRNIFREGETKVRAAVKNARDNNIFMVFLLLDNLENKNSILDGKYSMIEDNQIKCLPYMDKFPFPFYIILREISALPQVLGEALRQWFELVTSVDR